MRFSLKLVGTPCSKFFFFHLFIWICILSSCRGQKLLNPIKYHMCLICGPKHLDYTKTKLLDHYNKGHMANFSLENMPKSLKKCSICGEAFLTEELLLRHKSCHVDPRYFKNGIGPEAFEQSNEHF